MRTKQDQIISGVRAILSNPAIYDLAQLIMGGHSARKKLVKDHIKIFPGMRILDVGCGPGSMLKCLPASQPASRVYWLRWIFSLCRMGQKKI